jgi:hypothetical protein
MRMLSPVAPTGTSCSSDNELRHHMPGTGRGRGLGQQYNTLYTPVAPGTSSSSDKELEHHMPGAGRGRGLEHHMPGAGRGSGRGQQYDTLYTPGISSNPTTSKTPKNIITPDLVMALDRTKMTDRNASMVLSATAHALGHDIDHIALSRSTFYRTRINIRKKIAEDIKQTFTSDIALTVHWDGKLMPDITGHENVDRLPIIISGGGMYKLLAVPKLNSGTGEAMATAVYEALQDWNLCDRVQAMCFDTTASNTGNNLGACPLLQVKLEKKLLTLACRHHINEIVISDVFGKCYNAYKLIPMFKLFQKHWDSIDKKEFEPININIFWKIQDRKSVV